MLQKTAMDPDGQPDEGDKLEGRRKNPVTGTQIADQSTAQANEKHGRSIL